jgi:hypothetical protein
MSAQLAAANLVASQESTTPRKPYIVRPPESRPAHSRRTQSRPAHSRTSKSRHARRCTVCHHEDRPEIEDDFLHWRASTEIAAEYNLPDRRAVYRHARATGLYRRRMKNMRVACSYIAEHADRVTPNAKNVLDAIRACALIDDNGKWHEPTRRVIVEHVNAPPSAHESAVPNPENATAAATETEIPNVYSTQLKSGATATKQTPAGHPDVYSPANFTNPRNILKLLGVDELFSALRKPKRDPSADESASG